ncbi:MAG: FtsW/RodA/SpoVE family cell cycle protein [Bacteroidales bacterium]|nr:FtsW/RodA/SpoVE family cell cycle protein [Bacteroidales bacterium]
MFKDILIKFKGDKVIWRIIIALMLISVLSVYSSISLLAIQQKDGNTTFYIIKHMIIVGISLGIIYFFHKIDYRVYFKLAKVILISSIPLLLLTFFADDTNSAQRWLEIPGIGLSFQPSDYTKFALLIFASRILSQNQNDIGNYKKVLLPIVIVTGVLCSIILISNFSTSILLFIYVLVLLFVGRIPMKQLSILVGILSIVGFLLLMMIINSPETISRASTWKSRLNAKYPAMVETLSFVKSKTPEYKNTIAVASVKGENYQATQAKIAIANGGILGKGPGRSTQRDMLPQAYCDFIYAIIIEDYGLLGGIVVMILYLWLIYRAGIIIRKCKYSFPALLSFSLIFMMVMQSLVNMAVSVTLFPVTGQTMTLISMGGTSMFFTSISLGIILSISHSIEKFNVEEDKEDDGKEEKEEEKVKDDAVVEKETKTKTDESKPLKEIIENDDDDDVINDNTKK